MEAVQFDSAEVLVLAGSSNGSIKLWDLEEAKGVVHAYKAPAIGLYSKSMHLALIPFYFCCVNYGRFILCASQKFLLDLL